MANFKNSYICPIIKLFIAPSHKDIPPSTNLSSDGKFSQHLFLSQLCITNKRGRQIHRRDSQSYSELNPTLNSPVL